MAVLMLGAGGCQSNNDRPPGEDKSAVIEAAGRRVGSEATAVPSLDSAATLAPDVEGDAFQLALDDRSHNSRTDWEANAGRRTATGKASHVRWDPLVVTPRGADAARVYAPLHRVETPERARWSACAVSPVEAGFGEPTDGEGSTDTAITIQTPLPYDRADEPGVPAVGRRVRALGTELGGLLPHTHDGRASERRLAAFKSMGQAMEARAGVGRRPVMTARTP